MRRDHLPAVLRALALALLAVSASLALGLQKPTTAPDIDNLEHIEHISTRMED